LGALAFTVGNLFFHIPDQFTLLILQIVFGGLYIFFSIAEVGKQLAKSNMPYDRFFYLPFSVITNKTIKLGAFTIACCVLFLSKSTLVFLAGLLLMIIVADIFVFILRVQKKVYYVSLFSNYILFAQEDERKIFASHIKIIEYRYGIFYMELNNGKIYTIEVARIKNSDQTIFIEKFVLWVVCNKLHFTDEAKEKLADIIAEAL
jgi:hypothetical protein